MQINTQREDNGQVYIVTKIQYLKCNFDGKQSRLLPKYFLLLDNCLGTETNNIL